MQNPEGPGSYLPQGDSCGHQPPANLWSRLGNPPELGSLMALLDCRPPTATGTAQQGVYYRAGMGAPGENDGAVAGEENHIKKVVRDSAASYGP